MWVTLRWVPVSNLLRIEQNYCKETVLWRHYVWQFALGIIYSQSGLRCSLLGEWFCWVIQNGFPPVKKVLNYDECKRGYQEMKRGVSSYMETRKDVSSPNLYWIKSEVVAKAKSWQLSVLLLCVFVVDFFPSCLTWEHGPGAIKHSPIICLL